MTSLVLLVSIIRGAIVPSSQSSEEESKLVCVKYAWDCGHIESAMQLYYYFLL